MSYENAPQTTMLATNCIICGKELCDARSVEIGLGPVCRRRAGYEADAQKISEDDRKKANKLIHTIAVSSDNETRVKGLVELKELGLDGVVKAILKSIATVVVAIDNGNLVVKTPYLPEVVPALRSVPGRRFDWDAKVNRFPLQSKGALYGVLKQHFSGSLAVGPRGIFVVGDTEVRSSTVGKVVAA